MGWQAKALSASPSADWQVGMGPAASLSAAPVQASVLQSDGQWYQIPSLREVTSVVLIEALNQADVVLLGELHDNPRHHSLRGELLESLAHRPITLVAEHLPHGQSFKSRIGVLADLQAAGFDDKAWQWPLHQPLFETVSRLKLPMVGGNLSNQAVKSVYASKGDATPAVFKALLTQSPLSTGQQQALRDEIDQGHCGALPASQLDNMIAVQRARDAAMAQVALQHLPAVVLAGNGHVWKHLGVPQILQANRPDLKTVSVLFMEQAPDQTPAQRQAWLQRLAPQADWVWVGPVMAQRSDPCLAFKAKP